MYSKFGQFIDGKWQPSEKNETYDVINPATEEIIGKASATKKDVTKALKSAEEGFPRFGKNTCHGKDHIKLENWADLMRERKKEFS